MKMTMEMFTKMYTALTDIWIQKYIKKHIKIDIYDKSQTATLKSDIFPKCDKLSLKVARFSSMFSDNSYGYKDFSKDIGEYVDFLLSCYPRLWIDSEEEYFSRMLFRIYLAIGKTGILDNEDEIKHFNLISDYIKQNSDLL